jgi:hypothetical protein
MELFDPKVIRLLGQPTKSRQYEILYASVTILNRKQYCFFIATTVTRKHIILRHVHIACLFNLNTGWRFVVSLVARQMKFYPAAVVKTT